MSHIGSHECAQVDKIRVNPLIQSTHRAEAAFGSRYHVTNKKVCRFCISCNALKSTKVARQLRSTHEEDQCGSAGWPERVCSKPQCSTRQLLHARKGLLSRYIKEELPLFQ